MWPKTTIFITAFLLENERKNLKLKSVRPRCRIRWLRTRRIIGDATTWESQHLEKKGLEPLIATGNMSRSRLIISTAIIVVLVVGAEALDIEGSPSFRGDDATQERQGRAYHFSLHQDGADLTSYQQTRRFIGFIKSVSHFPAWPSQTLRFMRNHSNCSCNTGV